MSIIASLSLVSAEALMCLYPVLVKNVKTDLLTHTMVRLLTAAILSYPFASVSIGHFIGQLSYYLVSFLYVLHIYASYIGFLNLDVGVALTLFYIYPLINVLINDLFIIKQFNLTIIYYLFISLFGVFLITKNGKNKEHMTDIQPHIGNGVLAMSVSILTESLIYTFYKTGSDTNPFNMLFSLCLVGAIVLLLVWLYQNINPNTMTQIQTQTPTGNGSHQILKLIMANAILGVGGYLLRFYSIAQISTEWFSVLSFTGVIFGYLYGWIFYGEMINLSQIIGTLLIVYSVYQVKVLGF